MAGSVAKLLAVVALAFAEGRHVERRSGVEEMIAGLRSKAQQTHAFDDAEGTGRPPPQRTNFFSEDPRQRRKRGLPPVLLPASGDVDANNFDGPYPRPLTERNAGQPCSMQGLIVRREMGNTGVTAFQVFILARVVVCPKALLLRHSSPRRAQLFVLLVPERVCPDR